MTANPASRRSSGSSMEPGSGREPSPSPDPALTTSSFARPADPFERSPQHEHDHHDPRPRPPHREDSPSRPARPRHVADLPSVALADHPAADLDHLRDDAAAALPVPVR